MLSLPDVGRRPPSGKIYFNKAIARQPHSAQRQYRVILSRCAAQHTDTNSGEEKEEDVSKATLIWRAIKLPIYTVALIPIAVSFFTKLLNFH